MDTSHAAQFFQGCVPKANHIGIFDLPEDVLILIFSSLHGQDVGRCVSICRRFSVLIRGDLSLQYSVELAMNGMVDGDSNSTIPVFERLQHLHQYSSDFKSGAFQHQDLTAHPDYLRRDRGLLGWPWRVVHPTKPSGAIYMKADLDDSTLYLTHFVPGSSHAGIPSSRSLLSVRDGVKPDLALQGWAVDDAQDLFVMVEMTRMSLQMDVIPDVYVHLYSMSGLRADTVPPTPHPAATHPVILLHKVATAGPISVFEPQIFGPHLIVQIQVNIIARQPSYFIDVYNWNTGEMLSRTDVGNVVVTVIPLDERYLLVFPSDRVPEQYPDLRIYSFAPSGPPRGSSSSSLAPPRSSESDEPPEAATVSGRHICTLQLPPSSPGERVTWSQAKSGDRSSEESKGHFRADAARSVVALYIQYEGFERGNEENGRQEEDEDEDEDEPTYAYATHVLIPRTTLAAQIQAAESSFTSQKTGGGDASPGLADTSDQPEQGPTPLVVPWADWGAHGALRLYQRGALFDREHIVVPAPFGSRFPFIVPGSDTPEEPAGTGDVYVFDMNPLVARSIRGATSGARTALVNAEDIEKVLPGVVDPECATIPYVVYRFPLPYPDPPSTDAGAPGLPVPLPEIRAMTMSMAGFTVQFDDSVEYEKQFQTCTV